MTPSLVLSAWLSLVAVGAAAPVPDLFRPDPRIEFVSTRGHQLIAEARSFQLRVQAIDTLVIRVRGVAPSTIQPSWGDEEYTSDNIGEEVDGIPVVWTHQFRLTRPADSGITWTARFDLDSIAKRIPGQFLVVKTIASPDWFVPRVGRARCDSSWAEGVYNVSDLGLLGTTLGEDSVEITAIDLSRSALVSGVLLSRPGDSARRTFRTDANGRVRVPRADELGVWMGTVAKDRAQVAVLAIGNGDDSWGQGTTPTIHGGWGGNQIASNNGIRLLPYLSHALHRPGDSVVLGCIVRGAGGTVPGGRTLKVRLQGGRRTWDSTTIRVGPEGHVQWRLLLPRELPTGGYNIEVDLDRTTENVALRVEQMRIPKLSVEARFDTVTGDRIRISARWLTGRPANGLAVTVRAGFTEQWRTRRATIGGWEYQSRIWPSAIAFKGTADTLYQGVLDGHGGLSLPLARPQRISLAYQGRVSVSVNVFESNGHEVSTSLDGRTRTWRAGPGLSIASNDTLAMIHAAWFDARDSMVDSVPLRLRLLRDSQEILTAQVPSGKSWNIPVSAIRRKLDTTRARSFVVVACDQGGEACVQSDLMAFVNHSRRFSWGNSGRLPDPAVPEPVVESGEDTGTIDPFEGDTVDASGYSPRMLAEGDTAQVRWFAECPGLALVQVVQGTRLLLQRTMPVVKGAAIWRHATDSSWVPGVHLVVSEFRNSKDSSKWLRQEGVHISVTPKMRDLGLVLMPDSVFHPLATARVGVRNPSGRVGTLVVSAVDQGILDLGGGGIPDPDGVFAEEEMLRIGWCDGTGRRDRPYLLSASGICNTDPDATAGGVGYGSGSGSSYGRGVTSRGGVGRPLARLRSESRPMAWVSKIMTLKPGDQYVEFPMPSYTGAVRVSAIAAAGRVTQSVDTLVHSRSDLELQLSLPQFLTPRDTVRGTLVVFGPPGARGRAVFAGFGPLAVVGDTAFDLSFDSSGTARAGVLVAALDDSGEAYMEARVRAGASAMHQPVATPVQDDRNLSSQVVSGRGKGAEFPMVLPSGFSRVGLETRLEARTSGYLGADRRVRELVRYPHGCLEQTVSAAFPQLSLERLLPDFPSVARDSARVNISVALAKLPSFETPSGLLSLWPGMTNSDPWATLWAARFLREAVREKYDAPSSFGSRLEMALNDARFPDPVDEAYRLSLIARKQTNGAIYPVLDSLSRLSLSASARWTLAVAYDAAGLRDNALAQVTLARATRDTGATVRAYRIRDRALILDAMASLDLPQGRDSLADLVALPLAENVWLSTKDLALSLTALARVVKPGDTLKPLPLQWRSGRGGWKDLRLKKGGVVVALPASVDTIWLRGGSSKAPLRAQVQRSGRLIAPDNRRDSGYSLQVSIVRDSLLGPVAASLREGDEFSVQIRVRNTSGQILRNTALTFWTPAGWSVRKEEMDSMRRLWNFIDIRADRVVHHFDMDVDKEVVVRIPLRAVQAGSFSAPEAVVEALYDGALVARWRGARAVVGER